MLSSKEIIAVLMGLHKDENNPLATRVIMRIAANEMELLISHVKERNRQIEQLRARVAELEAEREPAH